MTILLSITKLVVFIKVRTVMKELEEMGLSWGEEQTKAQGRVGWRSIIAALCPRRDEEVD